MDVLYIVIIVVLIGVTVFLLRKYIPGLKNEETKDEAEQVEEEVNRMIVNPTIEEKEVEVEDEEE